MDLFENVVLLLFIQQAEISVIVPHGVNIIFYFSKILISF